MRLTKETLSKMTVAQLEGKLMEAKSNFAQASTQLSAARQAQILKTKQIRGNASKRKKELISQILGLQRQTERVIVQREKITIGENIKFSAETLKAVAKVKIRAVELKETGTYKTSLSNYEKVLSLAYSMGVDKEVFDALLANYTIEELASMTGDEFYDQVKSADITINYDGESQPDYDRFDVVMF